MTTRTRTKSEQYIFSRIGPARAEELVEELLPWVRTIWMASDDDRRKYLNDEAAFETFIHVQRRAADDEVIGVTLAKMYDVRYRGEDLIICKLGLGVSPEYRGRNFALRHLMKSLPQAKLWYPRRKFYLISTLVHPVTYRLSCNLLAPRLYPYYGTADQPDFGQPELRELLDFLAGEFGIERADSGNPIVFKEHFHAHESAEERAYWASHTHPAIRFFLDNVPDYDKDECMIMLAPLDLPFLARTMVGTLARAQWRRLRRGVPKQFQRSRS